MRGGGGWGCGGGGGGGGGCRGGGRGVGYDMYGQRQFYNGKFRSGTNQRIRFVDKIKWDIQ
jgi:hypothetical protein